MSIIEASVILDHLGMRVRSQGLASSPCWVNGRCGVEQQPGGGAVPGELLPTCGLHPVQTKAAEGAQVTLVQVMPEGDGWKVVVDATQEGQTYDTQEEAEKIGRTTAQGLGAEFQLHGVDG